VVVDHKVMTPIVVQVRVAVPAAVVDSLAVVEHLPVVREPVTKVMREALVKVRQPQAAAVEVLAQLEAVLVAVPLVLVETVSPRQ